METKHNETTTAHEWDEMRAQWAALNRKLSNEPLVDDRHIRESMGKHQAWGKRTSKWGIVALPLYLLLAFYIAFILGADKPLSLQLIGCTLGLMALNLVIEFILYIKAKQLFTKDLISVSRGLILLKKIKRQVFLWGLPPSVMLFLWATYDAVGVSSLRVIPTWIFFAAAFGLSIFLSRLIYKEHEWMDDKVLRQIKELTEGENSQHASTDNL